MAGVMDGPEWTWGICEKDERERENNKTNAADQEEDENAAKRGSKRGRGEPRRRGDRYWRRSNNGLLAMIIEHEAAGTLLKSTENRAGGFTCRINFYLVSSLPRSLALPFLSSSPPSSH